MKYILFGLIFFFGWCSSIMGQTLYVYGGLSAPVVPNAFNKVYDAGPHVGIGFGYPLSSTVELVVHGTYSQMGLSEAGLLDQFLIKGPSQIQATGDPYTVVSGIIGAKIDTPRIGVVDPYFMGTLGWYQVTLGAITLTDPETSLTLPEEQEQAIGAGLGGGVMFEISSKLNTFLQINYIVIFTNIEGEDRLRVPLHSEPTNVSPVQLGLSLSF